MFSFSTDCLSFVIIDLPHHTEKKKRLMKHTKHETRRNLPPVCDQHMETVFGPPQGRERSGSIATGSWMLVHIWPPHTQDNIYIVLISLYIYIYVLSLSLSCNETSWDLMSTCLVNTEVPRNGEVLMSTVWNRSQGPASSTSRTSLPGKRIKTEPQEQPKNTVTLETTTRCTSSKTEWQKIYEHL